MRAAGCRCSWNAYHRNFNESVFYETADAMVANGMQAAGYEYINVDGGWWGGSDTGHIVRNSSGFFDYNHQKYPHGIKAVADYIHSKGFLYGHCELQPHTTKTAPNNVSDSVC
jgi:alpha-galactosidase|eukprot:COSAG01_NODE_7127_length_3338_cov_2.237728_6_plen_113_part_00